MDFTVSTDEDHELEPVPFTLKGVYASGQTGPNGVTTWEETFHASPVPPLAIAQSLGAAYVTDPGTQKTIYNLFVVLPFIRDCLVLDDAQRFDALVNDKTRLVHAAVLGKIMAWLTEMYMGPTGAPSLFSNGGAPTVDGSPAGPGSQG